MVRTRRPGNRRSAGALAAALVALAAAPPVANAATEIRVLSNRPDLISGGDALVEVAPPPPPGTVIALDGSDVTAAFALRANGRYLGRVSGLALGANLLSATLPDASGASLVIVNHPAGGPVFSGPHLEPWDCTTQDAGLGPPLDDDCNVAPLVEFLYMPTGGGDYLPYEVANPPADVSTVTNSEGATVRHIVRRESGAINRALYAYAVLYDPALPWEIGVPQPGWNGKLFIPFGGSGNTNHTQGSSRAALVTSADVLGRGFAVGTTTFNELGHHIHTLPSAEAAMMLKERIAEQLGEIRYTIGDGGSGGAVGQLQIANAYPGILDGLMVHSTLLDIWSSVAGYLDCVSLEYYWPTALVPFTPLQRQAVDGQGTPNVCSQWLGLFSGIFLSTSGCFSGSTLPTVNVSTDPRDYNPVTNPDGCRATPQDIAVNVWGRRGPDDFAKFPADNIGIQYGLDALKTNVINFVQFLDLNSRIGGNDVEGLPSPERTRADPGTPEIAYRSGNVNDARGLADVAIIDMPMQENLDVHQSYRSHALEERLIRAHGHADNQAMWRGIDSLVPSLDAGLVKSELALDVMDAWLAAVEADASGDPRSLKIVRNRPPQAVDSCFIGGSQVFDAATCDAAFPHYATARIVAGGPLSDDKPYCRLKPVDPADYAGVFPPLGALEIAQIEAAFPEGVCDYSQPAVGQAPSVAWLDYADGPGGTPLGAPPVSAPFQGLQPLPEPAAALPGLAALLALARLRRRS